MSRKAIVIANHKTKTATLNFVDEENNQVATDHKNQPLIGMTFPYSNIEEYHQMYEKRYLHPPRMNLRHFYMMKHSSKNLSTSDYPQ